TAHLGPRPRLSETRRVPAPAHGDRRRDGEAAGAGAGLTCRAACKQRAPLRFGVRAQLRSDGGGGGRAVASHVSRISGKAARTRPALGRRQSVAVRLSPKLSDASNGKVSVHAGGNGGVGL